MINDEMIAIPDFFIVGAPKCGTTAMFEYLGKHPDIYIPKYKETHHFASDLIPMDDHFRSVDNYLKIFQGAQKGDVIGDASVFYLYSKEAAHNINRFNDRAKIIIMIRDPVDMLESYHSQLVFNGDEDIEDLKKALDAEGERKKGNLIPKGLRFKERLFYYDISCFSDQINRYFDVFGKERVHVIIYDEFKEQTEMVYARTLEFLEVDPAFRTEFEIINPCKRVRSRLIREFLLRPPKLVRMISRSILFPVREAIYRKLMEYNSQFVTRQPMDPDLRRYLREKFRPEIERLGILLKRNFEGWMID
ncbi:MAG: sulfotransferase [Nitrospirota bacterium]|nr:MAG: sulfotransferase [Nitrospirota bacterium]